MTYIPRTILLVAASFFAACNHHTVAGTYLVTLTFAGGTCNDCPTGTLAASIAVREESDGITTVQVGVGDKMPAQVDPDSGTLEWTTTDTYSTGCWVTTDRSLEVVDGRVVTGSFTETQQCLSGSPPKCSCTYGLSGR